MYPASMFDDRFGGTTRSKGTEDTFTQRGSNRLSSGKDGPLIYINDPVQQTIEADTKPITVKSSFKSRSDSVHKEEILRKEIERARKQAYDDEVRRRNRERENRGKISERTSASCRSIVRR